jgi:hypothetical protein
MKRVRSAFLAALLSVAAALGLSVVAAGPASAGVICSKAHVCPNVKHAWTKNHSGYILMYDEVSDKDKHGKRHPYGNTRRLYVGEWSSDRMKDPDWLKAIATGGQGNCVQLRRSDAGRDTRYREEGVKIRDNENHRFYTTAIPCSQVKRGQGKV